MTSYGLFGGEEGAREPGSRRRKLAGYLKAANELRQTYQQQYTQGWGTTDSQWQEGEDAPPGGYPEGAVVRSGDQQMILFPSYARRHVRVKPEERSRSDEDSAGTGDQDFWQREWDQYEDDHAIVDVDVRGWVFAPHKGPLNRKHRIAVGLARQLVGLPAPSAPSETPSAGSSLANSRNPSPHGHRERVEERRKRRDEDLIEMEAESILRKGEAEADVAGRGAYSEAPGRSGSITKLQDSDSKHHAFKDDGPPITPLQKRASWNQPADMTPAELSIANSNLMARLRPFLANPMANTPISAFFYDDKNSRQRTIYTNPSGQFSLRAALDFVPTHVRILASEKLSATEEVIVTTSKGVSIISDIDDTIKHSAISSGAREIFRNAFIRELHDLTIEGVQEWYAHLSKMGASFHYVSNSPWQLYPVLQKYFSLAGLPSGSFHLKQYSGMLQGIFEPVAERKKGTLDRIARDFPERRFILIGDSGEADLEVYTDFVLENPGRVLGVFIRDVTTSIPQRFFDSSMGPLTGERSPRGRTGSQRSPRGSLASQYYREDDDPQLKAAISASLRDLEEQDKASQVSTIAHRIRPGNGSMTSDQPKSRPSLPPRRPTDPCAPEIHQMGPPMGNLIDFSDDDQTPSKAIQSRPSLNRGMSESVAQTAARRATATDAAAKKSRAPAPPRKPVALRSPSGGQEGTSSPSTPKIAPPPPKPRRTSAAVSSSPSRSSVASRSSTATDFTDEGSQPQAGYAATARQKISSVYNHIPPASSYVPGVHANNPPDQARTMSTSSSGNPNNNNISDKEPPKAPPRQGVSSYPAAAAQYASSYWNGSSTSNNGSASRAQSFNNQNPEISKREAMWRQRWERAEHIMRKHGVVLKTWRVGTDLMELSEKMVRDALRRDKWEEREEEWEGGE
ncbi:hypothetical protein K402DRAFT_416646 [Aulographum hederae CBS 113979]|uniref:Phosphatidate phosphatase APP1 catalytic domain-containing protein n=1 Tax=Aulographum hederae CBS 113979 TaxID=1176131 RepID=A0A6G1HEG6_9PEZI|nr:hypothetical protein K402DRAFT_416646 [Aulographum hederae CBS 113979]